MLTGRSRPCMWLVTSITGEVSDVSLSSFAKKKIQATATTKPSDSQKAKAFWTMKAARDRDDELSSSKERYSRKTSSTDLWEIHLKSPVAALTKASADCMEAHYDC